MPSQSDSRLAVRRLGKRFGSRVVLDGVDLEVAAGSIVLLAGSNGSGKTTLLRCVAGLARHDGSVALDGRTRTRGCDLRRDIGYLPQAVGLPTWSTVAEVLDLFGRLRGATSTVVPLPDGFLPEPTQPIGQLSGGQCQRVAIGVALLGQPRLLLLDEPAANLDEWGRDALVAILESVRGAGGSVLVAAPSPGDLNGLPDRTVHLSDGQVCESPALRLLPAVTSSGTQVQEAAR